MSGEEDEEPADDDLTFTAVDPAGNELGEIDLSGAREVIAVYAAEHGLTLRKAAEAIMNNWNVNAEVDPEGFAEFLRGFERWTEEGGGSEPE